MARRVTSELTDESPANLLLITTIIDGERKRQGRLRLRVARGDACAVAPPLQNPVSSPATSESVLSPLSLSLPPFLPPSFPPSLSPIYLNLPTLKAASTRVPLMFHSSY